MWGAVAAAAGKYVLPAILTGISSGISSGIGRRVEGAFLKRGQIEQPSYIGSPNFGPQYLMAAENRAYASQSAKEERDFQAAEKRGDLAEEEYRHRRDFETRHRESVDAYERAVELEKTRAANQVALAVLQDRLAGERMKALQEQEIKARFLEDPYQFENWWKRMTSSGQDFLLGKGKRWGGSIEGIGAGIETLGR